MASFTNAWRNPITPPPAVDPPGIEPPDPETDPTPAPIVPGAILNPPPSTLYVPPRTRFVDAAKEIRDRIAARKKTEPPVVAPGPGALGPPPETIYDEGDPKPRADEAPDDGGEVDALQIKSGSVTELAFTADKGFADAAAFKAKLAAEIESYAPGARILGVTVNGRQVVVRAVIP